MNKTVRQRNAVLDRAGEYLSGDKTVGVSLPRALGISPQAVVCPFGTLRKEQVQIIIRGTESQQLVW